MVTKGERGRGERNWEIGIDIYTLLHMKQMTNKDLLYKRKELYSILWPMWENNPRESGYMYICNQVTLLYSRNEHNIVSQLYSNEN